MTRKRGSWDDIHNPLVGDLAGDRAVVSEPVAAFLSDHAVAPEVVDPDADHDLDLRSDPIRALGEDHIRVGHSNRVRRSSS